MPRPRHKIAAGLGAIMFIAVGFAALREADEPWDSGLFSLTLGLLMLALLLAAHRIGARRAFWAGFALFGWGYLGLSLATSIEPRLIATRALAGLRQSNLLGVRTHELRAPLNLDRMRALNVSPDDIRQAIAPSRMVSPAGPGGQPQATYRRGLLTWEDRRMRYSSPRQYEFIILRANAEGEILRLKDVAAVEVVPSSSGVGISAGTDEDFIRIGHSLVALLSAWLGGVLSRRLRSRSEKPDNG